MIGEDTEYLFQNVISGELPIDGYAKPGYGPREMNLSRVQFEFDNSPYEIARQAQLLEEARARALKEEWIIRQREIEADKEWGKRYDENRAKASRDWDKRIKESAAISKNTIDEIARKLQADIDSRPVHLCNCAQLNRLDGAVRICDQPRGHSTDHHDSTRSESWARVAFDSLNEHTFSPPLIHREMTLPVLLCLHEQENIQTGERRTCERKAGHEGNHHSYSRNESWPNRT